MKLIRSTLQTLPFVVFFLLGTGASAQSSLQICSNSEMQNTCPASCAQLNCGDESFLENNVTFCVTNFFNEESRAKAKDSAACSSILGVAANSGTETEDAQFETTTAVEEDCTRHDDIFAQEECELAKLAPSCSPTVVELEGRSALLVTDIKAELSTYGDLLTRDYSDVKERDALCAFTRDELSSSFKLASENPAILKSLQRQAQDVQACQTDWEDVVRGYKAEGTSDSLIDTLVRGSEAKLEDLKVEISSLTTSVDKLENAATTIRGIIRLYVAFCDG